jgi:hypothetical protein
MTAILHRRIKLPVLSRLAWAWMASAAAALAISAFVILAGDKIDGPARVALAVGSEVETMARPALRAPATASVLDRKTDAASGAPALRDGAPDAALLAETQSYARDVFGDDAAPYAGDLNAETLSIEDAGDVIITIGGAPARHPGQKVAAPQRASFAKPTTFAPAPDPALQQKTPLGAIPKVAADGRKSSRYYALAFDPRGKPKRVAIIVGGLGLNPSLTERAINELPPTVTLAFAPYAKDLDVWTKKAREAGHELMIEVPMEGYGGGADALGPAALLTNRSADENRQRLDWTLSRFNGYFGATNYLGGKFSADRDAMTAVLARLEALGVAYVDDTGAARRAMEDRKNVAVVNRMIAPGPDGASMNAARRDLVALETIAARDGDALGKAYAYDGTIDAIVDWAGSLEGRDIALAPASAVLQARGVAR